MWVLKNRSSSPLSHAVIFQAAVFFGASFLTPVAEGRTLLIEGARRNRGDPPLHPTALLRAINQGIVQVYSIAWALNLGAFGAVLRTIPNIALWLPS